MFTIIFVKINLNFHKQTFWKEEKNSFLAQNPFCHFKIFRISNAKLFIEKKYRDTFGKKIRYLFPQNKLLEISLAPPAGWFFITPAIFIGNLNTHNTGSYSSSMLLHQG